MSFAASIRPLTTQTDAVTVIDGSAVLANSSPNTVKHHVFIRATGTQTRESRHLRLLTGGLLERNPAWVG